MPKVATKVAIRRSVPSARSPHRRESLAALGAFSDCRNAPARRRRRRSRARACRPARRAAIRPAPRRSGAPAAVARRRPSQPRGVAGIGVVVAGDDQRRDLQGLQFFHRASKGRERGTSRSASASASGWRWRSIRSRVKRRTESRQAGRFPARGRCSRRSPPPRPPPAPRRGRPSTQGPRRGSRRRRPARSTTSPASRSG